MADFNERPSEDEALQFKKEHDERVEKAREGMGYKAKVDAPAEEAVIETPAESTDEEEVETPATEEETEEESEEESDDTEEDTDSQPRDKSVFRQLNEIRSQKRAAEAEKDKLLAELAKSQEENKALKANQPPPQPFVDFAKSKGIENPTDVKEMYDLFRSQMEEDFGAKINALDEQIKTFAAAESARSEQTAYNDSMGKLTDEWSQVLPVIESEYKPNAAQSEQAFQLMAELAHSEKYHDKELDYILFKEAPKFEEIFGARKRRTMFSSHGRSNAESKQPPKRDGSHESIMALRREQQSKMHGADGFDIVENGEI
jgi:hypothetical protein